MDDKEADEHLKKLLPEKKDVYDETGLFSNSEEYLAYNTSQPEEAVLDGRFTADDLEAIARYMRNPDHVLNS